VKQVFSICACLAFAASLHASVPSVTSSHSRAAAIAERPTETLQQLPLTAAPADRQSFYLEFYGTGFHSDEDLPAPATERKPGLLRRFANVVKKTAQKVNLIPN
jgi:hypothetical protein